MAKPKYLSENGLLYLWQRLATIFATKSEAASSNVIEIVKVNNSALTPDGNKAVNVTVPTNNNQLTNGAGYQTASDVSTAISGKADSATTLSGYGITDAYTKTETNTALSSKADSATTLSGYGITNAYTKTETDAAISEALSDVTGIDFQIVQSLPVTGEKGVIYLLSNSGTGTNVYDEYIWLTNKYEKIGTTEVDLSNYLNNTDELSNAEIDDILGS